jgi:transmembrane sensor
MNPSDQNSHHKYLDPEEQAAKEFLTRRSGDWVVEDEVRYQASLKDPEFETAANKVERIWDGIGQNPNRPEFLSMREQALARARRTNRRRWSLPWTAAQRSWGSAAAVASITIAAGIIWQLSPYGYRSGVYQTDIGEQRTVELADHSRIALDSNTKIRATLTADARTIEITRGQAQFSVTHDPTRPFKVIAGDHTIVAVGTVFTVEYADQTVHVAMMEGKVAVLSQESVNDLPIDLSAQGAADPKLPSHAKKSAAGAAPSTIELSAGEELRFAKDGRATVTPKADIEAATAWREGKVIFHSEPLGEAVRRLNRYSKVQLQIDGEALSNLSVSGVFEAGDSRAFADAVQAYLPVTADYSQGDLIKLRMK